MTTLCSDIQEVRRCNRLEMPDNINTFVLKVPGVWGKTMITVGKLHLPSNQVHDLEVSLSFESERELGSWQRVCWAIQSSMYIDMVGRNCSRLQLITAFLFVTVCRSYDSQKSQDFSGVIRSAFFWKCQTLCIQVSSMMLSHLLPAWSWSLLKKKTFETIIALNFLL